MQKGIFDDKKQVLIKTKFGKTHVPYQEVRLGLHDENFHDLKIKDDCRKRMGGPTEASVYAIQKEKEKVFAVSKVEEKAEKKKSKASI